ncbi:MAG: YidC/Oxa1 family membrane protein insertase [Desulfovibrio sp.]|nr:YidC/Oxa1 family membrane protein insertase [Desulfovibrio sp.]
MLDLLWLIFIAPIQFFMEVVFEAGHALTHSYGLALIGVSLVVNTAVLPIYNKAEAWQEEERALKKRMEPKEKMIRRCFRGQERFAMLSTLYRQSGYSPVMTLRASVGILLQIPFFLAAYLLLSNMSALDGVSFGPIRDLGAPDGLLAIGGLHINVLPLLMTAINLFSAFFYTHGLSRRDKIQLYAMAGIFLVLLYNSPAGLTFYWTLNNIYSLCKNIVQKDWMKRPGWTRAKQRLAGGCGRLGHAVATLCARAWGREVPVFAVFGLMGAAGLILLGYGAWKHAVPSLAMSALVFGALAALAIFGRERFPHARRLPAGEALAVLTGGLGLPYVLARYGLKQPGMLKLILGLVLVGFVVWALTGGRQVMKRAYAHLLAQRQELARLFLPAAALMAFLVCVYFPFLVFSSDPVVFGVSLESFASYRLGTFYVVMTCVAVLSACARPVRWLLGSLFFVLALSSLAFCFIVAPNVGVMDSFVLMNAQALERWYNGLLDVAVVACAFALFAVAVYFGKARLLTGLVYATLLLLVVMTGVYFSTAEDVLVAQKAAERPVAASREVPGQVKDFFTFTKTGKNIVVVMLDGFTGGHMNQLLERHPELRAGLAGFTWYEDTVSGGSVTVIGKPGILGGADCNPVNLNQDKTRSLEEKISRAYARLFSDLQAHDFRISVYDGLFFDPESVQAYMPKKEPLNFINDGLGLMWPGALSIWQERAQFGTQIKILDYNRFFDVIGLYNIAPRSYKARLYGKGTWGDTIALGNQTVRDASMRLAGLEIPLYASSVSESPVNRFMYFTNLLTHLPWAVDEKGLPTAKAGFPDSRKLENGGLSEEHLLSEYFALRKLIDWFDWMKKNGVYDNTQIILVSDHDCGDSAEIVDLWGGFYPPSVQALLMVKEYGARGELVADRHAQMANWDVPALIENGLAQDDNARSFAWREAGRPRMHASPSPHNARRATQGKNTYIFANLVSIEGPLLKKESWKRVQGSWPPEK